MSKTKHWDESTQSWVIDGASNASNLELSNPGYVDENGNSVSIDHGFTKVYNKLTKLEQNLAWVYLNGAKGGGTGGGTTGISYTISVYSDTTITTTFYTSTGSITAGVLIGGGSAARSFTLIIKNIDTGEVLKTTKVYSLTRSNITLTGLTGSTNLEFSAYDGSSNYATPTYVTVVAGAISMSIQSVPASTIIRGTSTAVPATFTITNNIAGSPATFNFTVNGITIDNITNISTQVRTLSYNIRDWIFNNGLFDTINTGQKFTFVATASTVLNGNTISASPITFNVTVSEADSLIIVTDGITEFIPSTTPGQTYADLTDFSLGSQLTFTYYISYAPTIYKTFNIVYNVYKMEGTTKVSETPLSSGTIPNVPKGNNVFSISTATLGINASNQYLMIELTSSSVDKPSDTTAIYTKSVYCDIIEAEKVNLYANNFNNFLFAYYSNVTGFPASSNTVWNYKSSELFPYNGILSSYYTNGVNLILNGTNGSTSGFIMDTDGESTPGIVLSGESYAYIDIANHLFPAYDIGQYDDFFSSTGFNISLTYKAEESSDSDEVVMSIGRYNNGSLASGIEITLDKIIIIIGSADSIECKLPQNELLTIDIDVSAPNGISNPVSNTPWYFKIYINGVLSGVSRVLQQYIDWTFAQNLYFGCRNNLGVRSNYSSVTIYDIKLYTSSQTEFAIVQNYISATEQANLISGIVDSTLDTSLREKNLFDSKGNCLIWNSATNNFLEGEALYNTLLSYISKSIPYPLVLIEETSTASTEFEAYSTATFSSSDKDTVMNARFPCKITFTNSIGSAVIEKPSSVSDVNGVKVGLQGTSSLSYNSKNYEIYMGDMDDTGKKLLFTPEQPGYDWLPENEFTLKADVMDSAHVNNVVIGKIINGAVKNKSGEQIKPLVNTPPMNLPDSVFSDSSIKSKMKHTSEGFPCLVFIKFAPDSEGSSDFKFCGIYNFNLGRYALHNLGLTLLTSYTKVSNTGPTLISDYTENDIYWNTNTSDGVYSMEINQNNSAQGAFQQDDIDIVKFMADAIYSSRDTDIAYNRVQGFYSQMANMTLTTIPKYTVSGSTMDKLISGYANALWNPNTSYNTGDYVYNDSKSTYQSLVDNNTQVLPDKVTNDYWKYLGEIGTYYNYNSAYYNFTTCDNHLNWENACAYFIIALVFGMVDSMCKNLTLRSWGSDIWYTAFYDMDTAFGLNNAGEDIVEYWAHLNRYYNVLADDGTTTVATENNYVSRDEIKQYFASWWNRIWEILVNLPLKDSNIGSRNTIAATYVNLRENLFSDPDQFIDNYYKSYTDTTGSIIFNYDYRIKYLKQAQTYDIRLKKYSDSTDFGQLKFLHGNRVIKVKDWFKKRIDFLDGVYGIDGGLSSVIDSPINNAWLNNKATGTSGSIRFSVNMSALSKVLFRWNYDKSEGKFWLDENSISAIVPIPGGETVIYMYANKYITEFTNFKNYPWTALTTINFPLLKELDLSGLKNIPKENFMYPLVYDAKNEVGLKNIESLNLSNVSIINAVSYTLDVSNCSKLKYLNISGSNITNVTLPISAILETYNLSNTNITSLSLSNQSFLTTLSIDGCNSLTSISLSNCSSLTSLNIPSSVTSIDISNCASLNSLIINYSSLNNSISPLIRININVCPGLKTFNISGQNNPNLAVNLVGAWNLETLNLSNTNTLNIILPSTDRFTSLKSLDISNTTISAFNYNGSTASYLDLYYFKDLDNIAARNCTNITKVVCYNDQTGANPINLNTDAFNGCTSLTRVIGYYNICGQSVFKECGNLILNPTEVYANGNSQTFIKYADNPTLSSNSITNIKFDSSTISLLSCFEGCSSLSYNDFKFIMTKIGSSVTSIEAMFKGCRGINNVIWQGLFSTCRNLLIIKEAFSNCSLTGAFYSRKSNYSATDTNTWGILDFIPNVVDAQSAFSGNNLEWIDNNVFSPITTTNGKIYSNLVNIDQMFSGCLNLKSCTDTNANTPIEGNLSSETFFLYLAHLANPYPSNVFSGCQKINMNISEDTNGNTLLFHRLNPLPDGTILSVDNSLYTGINLIGEIKENVFGGITSSVGNNYSIPTFSKISSPFNSSGSQITMKLSEMGNIFSRISSVLVYAIGVFEGIKCSLTDSIPPDIFRGCSKLISIESLFSGLNFNNNNSSYTFPATYNDNGTIKGMFDDCISLQITKSLFSGCTNLKLNLVGEGFKNCKLTDVSWMFSNSGVYGVIPYRLFFMTTGTAIRQTITDMSRVFNGCWCLGYSIDRAIDTTSKVTNSSPIIYLNWSDHVTSVEGTPVSYKLDVSSLTKSYNYDRDENKYVLITPIDADKTRYTRSGSGTTGDPYVYTQFTKTLYTRSGSGTTESPYVYTESDYTSSSITYYITDDGSSYSAAPTLYVDNIDYNPGETAFDVWYLDGYGWINAYTSDTSTDDTSLANVKARLTTKYFTYDSQQSNAMIQQESNRMYIDGTHQNYAIPTDIFRYCNKTCDLSEVLSDLTWYKNTVVNEIVTPDTTAVEGLLGRIPAKIFNSLTQSTVFNGVFKDTNFDPYVGFRSQPSDIRGIMYPTELFRYNTKLVSVPNMFYNTTIPVGIDVNTNLFEPLINLTNVSNCWANCIFDKRPYNASSFPSGTVYCAQFDFEKLFKYNPLIQSASGLFAAYNTLGAYRGLYIITLNLLQLAYNINDISSMFYNNSQMSGEVPVFNTTVYKRLASTSNYLYGCSEGNITNSADLIANKLAPDTWK